MIHKVVYKIGQRLRNPSLQEHLDFLLKSDKWTKEQLEDYQLTKLKELLVFAYENSPYYTKVFDEIGFKPEEVESLDDLKRLPIIDKIVAIEHNSEILSRAHFDKLQVSESSGTSGATLVIKRSEEWDSHNRAALFRGYHWYGVHPWDRNGYFWGFNIAPNMRFQTNILDWLQNRFRIFSYSETEIRKFIKKMGKNTVYIGGYSSMIYETAKMVNKLGLGGHYNIRMVKIICRCRCKRRRWINP